MGFATDEAASLKLQEIWNSHAIKLLRVFRIAGVQSVSTDSQAIDPNRNRFGGKPAANKRTLSGRIVGVDGELVTIELKVESTDLAASPLKAPVIFKLQPPQQMRVAPANSVALYQISSDRAFTIGAVTDDGKTRMELDLNELPGAPANFYTRRTS